MPIWALSSRSSEVSTFTLEGPGPGTNRVSSSQPARAATSSTAASTASAFLTRGPRCAGSLAAVSGSVGPAPYDGHQRATGQAPHAGFWAWQQRRPCQIRWWLSSTQSFLGNSAPTACSALTGSVSSVQPNRRDSRPKWVSTVMPGMPNALPSTTFAVLRPTPGSSTRSLSRGGTSPPCRSTSAALSLSSDSVLARKKPSGPMIASSFSRSAAAIARASG